MQSTQRQEPHPSMAAFLVLHVLLALLWMGLMGWNGAQLIAGLVVGLIALTLSARVFGSGSYVRSWWAVLMLSGLFLLALIRANLQLARDILRKKPHFAPAILAFDVSGLGSLPTSLLISLVSLTPGSLSIDLHPCGTTLYVHTLYAKNELTARHTIEAFAYWLELIAGKSVSLGG